MALSNTAVNELLHIMVTKKQFQKPFWKLWSCSRTSIYY